MKLAIFNSFYFHFEMYGYIIDYCIKNNIKLDIFTHIDEDLGWIQFYKNTFDSDLINYINIEKKKFDIKNDYDKIILTTDDDKNIPDNIINEKFICIDHFEELRRPGVGIHISTRFFEKRPKIDWALPVYQLIDIKEKQKISQPNVVCIGRFCPKNMKLFEKQFEGFNETNFFFIDRYIEEYKHLYNKYKNITYLNKMKTTDMIDLLKKSDYILITNENEDHINKSISAAIPLGLNCLCRIIMPTKMNEYYKFKSVLTYDSEIKLEKPDFELIEEDLEGLINQRNKVFDKYFIKDKTDWATSMIVYTKSKQRYDNFINTQEIMNSKLTYIQMYEAFDSINNYQEALNEGWKNNYFDPNYIKYCNHNKGKLGCTLSHLLLWDKFLKFSDKKWLLVLEDDINLNSYNPAVISELTDIGNKVNSHFIQLFTNNKFLSDQLRQPRLCSVKNKDQDYILFKMLPQWGTVSYLIDKAGIEFLLSKLPVSDNIDVTISKYTKELSGLCLLHNMIINKGSIDATDKNSEFGSLLWNISGTK